MINLTSKSGPARCGKHARGFTLVEILLVVAILGTIAAVAVPMMSSGDPQNVQVAARAVANAMRFARLEAIRTGEPHGWRLHTGTTAKRIRVYRVDTTASPWAEIYDVYDPMTKNLYDFELASSAFGAIDSWSYAGTYDGSCNDKNKIAFDARGTPLCLTTETVMLLEYELTLSLGNASQKVTIDGFTGRVSIE